MIELFNEHEVRYMIDILTDIDGVEFYDAYKSKVMQNFDGLLVPVLHIDDILKNKMSTGRAKDKIDVEELKKLHMTF